MQLVVAHGNQAARQIDSQSAYRKFALSLQSCRFMLTVISGARYDNPATSTKCALCTFVNYYEDEEAAHAAIFKSQQ